MSYAQSVSSRSTSSGFPSSTTTTTTVSQQSSGSKGKKDANFVLPNSRRGGRDFKVVQKQKSEVSMKKEKSGGGGKGFRKVLGELIAGRNSSTKNVHREEEEEVLDSRSETPRPRLVNKTSEWVQQEAKRSQLRERELKRHEAEMRSSQSTVESLDDRSFYAYDLQSESDEFPAPPLRERQQPSSYGSISTFPNLSQLSLRDSYLEPAVPPRAPSRTSTLLTPTPADPTAARRLSSRSSPQLRPLFLPRNLPSDPLPPLPFESKTSHCPTISLPATPPASPRIEQSSPPRGMTKSSTSSSLPNSSSNDSDSLLAPSPSTIRTKSAHRQSYLPPSTNSLGLAVTTASPLTSSSPPTLGAGLAAAQKKLDTTTRMLLKALSFDLVYLAKISIPPPQSLSVASLEVLSSSGMPRPQPKFDPELHLSALRSTTGLLFHSPPGEESDDAYQLGLLMPIIAMRKVGYVLCAFTKDETKEIGERELRWVGRFAEELEGVVIGLGAR
ncbi:uncharacterized protein JCM6883_000896 [Sporobolomyces salmoneus]|uniref:uncharacterized protein n=1 Tax=Sporobolomyces salmoneus TaxID=183962 RepID=UPI00317F310B